MKTKEEKKLNKEIDRFLDQLVAVAAQGNADFTERLRNTLIARLGAKGFQIVTKDEVATDYELERRDA